MRRRLIRGVAAAAALAAVPLLGARFQEKDAAELAAKGSPR